MSIRLLTLSAITLSLAACTTTLASPPLASDCDADAVNAYLGQQATPGTIESARKAAGAALVRPIRPGQAVTLDFRGERLNLHVDAQNAIVRAACG